jgi:transaldolase
VSAGAAVAPDRSEADEKTGRDEHGNIFGNRMATEKLSDGIRLFAKDLTTLREMVSKKLEEAA